MPSFSQLCPPITNGTLSPLPSPSSPEETLFNSQEQVSLTPEVSSSTTSNLSDREPPTTFSSTEISHSPRPTDKGNSSTISADGLELESKSLLFRLTITPLSMVKCASWTDAPTSRSLNTSGSYHPANSPT